MHFLILSILLIILILLRLYKRSRYEGFENSKSLIICKADWCGHCKKAKPEFDKLSQSPIILDDGSTVNVKVLDADSDKSEIAKYKVKGFPTVLFDNNGEINEYPGPRTHADIIEFLQSHSE